MKKAGRLIILTAMILFIVCAQAEPAEDFFSQFEGMEWCFSSGAGGWSTDLRIFPDGSFSGEYHDSEMGESEEAYPDGTVYYCNFTGRLSMTGQVDQDTWKIRVESLAETPVQEKETIADGLRLVYSEPYGISEGD